MLKAMCDAVKKGNAYRLEKYGPPETFSESLIITRKIIAERQANQPKCLSMFASKEELRAIDTLKMQYQYWDEWTGGRFARRENPFLDHKYYERYESDNKIAYKHFIKNVKFGQVIRSNPVTGYWDPL